MAFSMSARAENRLLDREHAGTAVRFATHLVQAVDDSVALVESFNGCRNGIVAH